MHDCFLTLVRIALCRETRSEKVSGEAIHFGRRDLALRPKAVALCAWSFIAHKIIGDACDTFSACFIHRYERSPVLISCRGRENARFVTVGIEDLEPEMLPIF